MCYWHPSNGCLLWASEHFDTFSLLSYIFLYSVVRRKQGIVFIIVCWHTFDDTITFYKHIQVVLR